MVRHVALFKWKEGVGRDEVDAVGQALSHLPGLVPEIVAYSFGPDIGVTDGNWDYAITADVRDLQALELYVRHPAHRKVIDEAITPIRESRCSVQFSI